MLSYLANHYDAFGLFAFHTYICYDAYKIMKVSDEFLISDKIDEASSYIFKDYLTRKYPDNTYKYQTSKFIFIKWTDSDGKQKITFNGTEGSIGRSYDYTDRTITDFVIHEKAIGRKLKDWCDSYGLTIGSLSNDIEEILFKDKNAVVYQMSNNKLFIEKKVGKFHIYNSYNKNAVLKHMLFRSFVPTLLCLNASQGITITNFTKQRTNNIRNIVNKPITNKGLIFAGFAIVGSLVVYDATEKIIEINKRIKYYKNYEKDFYNNIKENVISNFRGINPLVDIYYKIFQ